MSRRFCCTRCLWQVMNVHSCMLASLVLLGFVLGMSPREARGQRKLLPQLNETDWEQIESWDREPTKSEPPLALARTVYYTKRLGKAQRTAHLSGMVESIKQFGPNDQWDDLLELPRLWKLQLRDAEGVSHTVIVPELPLAWRRIAKSLKEHPEYGEVYGVNLEIERGGDAASTAQLVVATHVDGCPKPRRKPFQKTGFNSAHWGLMQGAGRF